jgi:hypothetical protein
MKVTRDFCPASQGRGLTFMWKAEVEGEVFVYQYTIDTGRLVGPPPEYIERLAQREIAEALRRKLFGSRAL